MGLHFDSQCMPSGQGSNIVDLRNRFRGPEDMSKRPKAVKLYAESNSQHRDHSTDPPPPPPPPPHTHTVGWCLYVHTCNKSKSTNSDRAAI